MHESADREWALRALLRVDPYSLHQEALPAESRKRRKSSRGKLT